MSNMDQKVNQKSTSKRLLIALDEAVAKLEAVERSKSEPIAIIGMGCRFPGGANDSETFWQLLRDGTDAIRPIPSERWDIDAYYDPNPDTHGKMYIRQAGLLSQVDQFDPQFFGISPREAISLDPQQRLMLEVSWEALERAGQAPNELKDSQTGVFLGIGQNDYAQLQLNSGEIERINPYDGTGNGFCFASGRLSYFLGLQGPCLAIDTACSSSLVAVHLACQSLRAGECNLALAGGVQMILSPVVTTALCKMKALSPDGRCKTFDAAADGYGRGEGCGAIVLKRLSNAISDGDKILATIRGSAVNHDGASSGLTVPNKLAQEKLIKQTLKAAKVNPSQVSYIESHGTGTSLGDPIEVRALAAVLGQGRSSENPLIIGSVKTNIGHLEAAAGIAGLMKVVLQLQHEEIAPHLNFKQPNPHINWEELPVVVPTQQTQWSSDSKGRLAGVSSFGISGTNAHVILEEAPKQVKSQKSKVKSEEFIERPCHILTLSAKCEKALQELAQRYEKFLGNNSTVALPDICFTANTGRSHFHHRLAIVAESTEELRQQLKAFETGEDTSGVVRGQVTSQKCRKITFLFTGQDSQYVNMGRELYETQPTFRKTIEQCDMILRSYLDKALLNVLYPQPGENSPIDETAYTQPALFAIEYALFQLWKSWGLEPDIVMGHSVGEYVAATVAGVFSLEDGLKLIAERGRLMQSLPQDGAMISLLADPEQVIKAIQPYDEEVAIAAFNGATSTVISGKREAVHKVRIELEAEGVKSKTLQVSHGFHSPLMKPMLADFERVAREITYSPPQIDLISNVTGELATEEIATHQYWCNHILQPVKFARGMATLVQQDCEILLEIGSKPILLGMGRLCLSDADANNYTFLPSLRPQTSDWAQMLDSLAQLYLQGMAINWQSFERDDPQRHRVILPTYPFQRQGYWIQNNHNRQNVSSPVTDWTPLFCLLDQGKIEQVKSQLETEETLSTDEIKLLPKLLELIANKHQQQRNITAEVNGQKTGDRAVATSTFNTETQQKNWHQQRDELLAASPEKRRQLLKLYFGQLLAKVMKIKPSQLDWQQRLSSLGLDSLMATELRRRIEEQFSLSIPVEFLAELNLEQFLTQLLLLIEKHHGRQDRGSAKGISRLATVTKTPTKQKIEDNLWVISSQPNSQARLRLFCLPYAGAGASIFQKWSDELPSEIELCAIQLPGRESRRRESPLTRLKPVIQTLVPLLESYLDLPFVLFGHSMGALLSFELVRELRRQNCPLPVHLCVSGRNAPQLPDLKPPIHRLPDSQFIEKIKGFNGTPKDILEDQKLMQQYLPALRADFAILETYFYANEPPFDCPITAFGGLEDSQVGQAELTAWNKQTKAEFKVQMFAGDHFFLHSARRELLRAISEKLQTKLLILH